MRRSTVRWCALLLLTAGCAGAGARDGGPQPTRTPALPTAVVSAPPTPVAAEPSGAPSWTVTMAEVSGVSRGPDARTLRIDVLVPAGHEGCARNPRVDQYTEERGTIHANVIVDSAWSHEYGVCPDQMAASTVLTAPAPVGERTVVLNQHAWAPAGPTYRRCDDAVGCAPPADHCDPVWVLAAVQGLDVPRNSSRRVERCTPGWLVLKVDTTGTACGAAPAPGCSAPPAVTRFFLRWHDGWRLVAGTTTAGCDVVLGKAPTFPRDLCRDLPATR